jgi:AI-2 transport protein TqsA
MTQPSKVAVVLAAAVLLAAAAASAASLFAPPALALFIISIVWPMQRWLQARLPKLLALAITIVVTASVCLIFASLVVWGFSRVAKSFVIDAERYQALYANGLSWLDARGISIAAAWGDYFDVRWLLRISQQIIARLNTTLAFWLITLVYVILGLLEVDDMRRKLEVLDRRELARLLLDGSAATAAKLRKYLLVRTQMSLATGVLVGVFAWAVGLPFALQWGVIAFVLNYIPYLGAFFATLFPTLLAMTRFESWQAVLGVFAGLNIIQFAIGSYLEPRVAGSVLSISPALVLFATFFWTYLWGFFGTFIGVPITLGILTFCAHHPSSRWLADLLGGPVERRT